MSMSIPLSYSILHKLFLMNKSYHDILLHKTIGAVVLKLFWLRSIPPCSEGYLRHPNFLFMWVYLLIFTIL